MLLSETARRSLAGLERKSPLAFPVLPGKVSVLFKAYAGKAKLKDVTFHCLRDTYISRLAEHVTTPALMGWPGIGTSEPLDDTSG